MAPHGPSRPRCRPAVPFALAAFAVWWGFGAASGGPGMAWAEEAAGPALRSGAWAAEFELDPNYRSEFGVSTSATLSAKHLVSDRSALRLGVSAGFDESESDGDRSAETYSTNSIPDYTSYDVPVNAHDESHAYALLLHLLRYHPVREAVAIFWEIGPSLRYFGTEHHDEVLYPARAPGDVDQIDTYDRSAVRREAALDLNLGFEWFFNHRLSLGARIGAWAGYGWGSDVRGNSTARSDGSYYSRTTIRSDVEGVSVHTSPAAVLFSAYF